ncbi:MAG: DUF6273 domain-containing protein [Clostridia bacterium]|nr:DUF6273 domain-containing protein [Clostridia bacterium]
MKKRGISTALLLLALVWCPAAQAEEGAADLSEHGEHQWETVSSAAATCGEAGFTLLRCGVCHEEKYRRDDPATGEHHFGETGACDVCGYVEMAALTQEEALAQHGFYLEDADESGTYTTGDVVWFGQYPQRLLTEDDAAYALLQAEGEDLADGWTSFSYYSEGEISDYMFYKDVTVDGRAYRGVYLLNYRPYYTGLPAGPDASYIDDEGYELGKAYWFEFAPIAWNVLEYRDGCLLLNAKYCLDAQPFQALYEGNRSKMVIPGTEILTNDWEASSVRAFLNGPFSQLAFTQDEQQMIQPTQLNNRTTGYEPCAKFQITQNDTEDKVFLLSYEDVMNPDYGYPEKSSFDLETNGNSINDVPEAFQRRRSYTAYATIQGCRSSTQGVTADGEPACYYMLRSAGNLKFSITGVSKYGSASYSGSMNPTSKASQDGLSFNGDFGLLPALRVKVGQ